MADKPYVKSYLHSQAYSEECWNGDGYCDGIVDEGVYEGEPCRCSCHTGPDFKSIDEVVEYHTEMKQYK